MSSNEPRDQLAAIAKRIRSQAVISTRPGQLDELERIANDLAALELEFAGWRPPPRVIETPEELDALPPRSIVVDEAGFCAQRAISTWHRPLAGVVLTSDQVLRGGRVTVLWEPKETDDAQ